MRLFNFERLGSFKIVKFNGIKYEETKIAVDKVIDDSKQAKCSLKIAHR